MTVRLGSISIQDIHKSVLILPTRTRPTYLRGEDMRTLRWPTPATVIHEQALSKKFTKAYNLSINAEKRNKGFESIVRELYRLSKYILKKKYETEGLFDAWEKFELDDFRIMVK